MLNTNFLPSIFGSVALICVLSWPNLTSYRQVIIVQSIGAAALSIQFYLLGAWTAAGASALALTQLSLFAFTSNRNHIIFIQLVSILFLITISVIKWSGPESLLALFGSVAGSFARCQKSIIRMKICFLVGSPLWIIHNFIVKAPFALCIDSISITLNLLSICNPIFIKWHNIRYHWRFISNMSNRRQISRDAALEVNV